jgi:hypothetical protein
MTDDWRAFRPAIWLAMLGVAAFAVLNVYVGICLMGAAIGVGVRIRTRRRRIPSKTAGSPPVTRKPRRRGNKR